MQKKVLFSIFTLLTLFVIVLLVLLINSTNSSLNDYMPYKNSAKNENNTKKTTINWAKKLSIYKKSDYLMPVTDLYIKVKYKNIIKKSIQKKEKLFNLSIHELNNYSLFCILRILEDGNVPFVIENSYENSKIYINVKKESELSDISKKLKQYNIDFTIGTVER